MRMRRKHVLVSRETVFKVPIAAVATMASIAGWKADLRPIGLHYYGGIVEDADQVLEKHKIATQACFGTRSSVKKTVVRSDKENEDPTCSQKVIMIELLWYIPITTITLLFQGT